jgi:hypothetical protein
VAVARSANCEDSPARCLATAGLTSSGPAVVYLSTTGAALAGQSGASGTTFRKASRAETTNKEAGQ